MSEIRIIVHNVPLEGWQWRLVAGGNTLKSGSAKTETEAHQEANAALRRLKANRGYSQKEGRAELFGRRQAT
jgi:hypothetical protein